MVGDGGQRSNHLVTRAFEPRADCLLGCGVSVCYLSVRRWSHANHTYIHTYIHTHKHIKGVFRYLHA